MLTFSNDAALIAATILMTNSSEAVTQDRLIEAVQIAQSLINLGKKHSKPS